jgi:hypothetical protein
VSTVLRANVEAGSNALRRDISKRGHSATSRIGSVQVQHLDWMTYAVSADHEGNADPLGETWLDLIITTDTLYTPSLTVPLWTTITAAAKTSRSRHPIRRAPGLLLALENRDGRQITEALQVGRDAGWSLKRVPDTRVQKAVEKAGWGWGRADWEGVEVWKGRLGGT